jgi:hypothetical protein
VPIVKVNSQSRIKQTTVFTLATLILIVLCAGVSFSQSQPSPTPPPRSVDGTFKNPDDTPLTTFEEEMKAKREIKIAEKDHEENLSRAKEIGEIAKQLKEGVKNNATSDCFKKIDRLEKLAKKVRSEAGGEEEDMTITPRPADLPDAIKQIAEASEKLSKEVQDTPRRVVSTSVISNSNVLLELIKLARSFLHPQQ